MPASLREFLAYDPLARTDAELRRREALARFGRYLPAGAADLWPCSFWRFAVAEPWRYWDPETVDECLEILERSPERTAEAISLWAPELEIGFASLLHPSPAHAFEMPLKGDEPNDLILLATQLHPEYLRRAEHIFGNLLTVYWGILRGRRGRSRFILRGASAELQRQGHSALSAGYDEVVRNGIAHGEVVFSGSTIRYGDPINGRELSVAEFLSELDVLWRTAS